MIPPLGADKSSALCSCGTNPVTQSEFPESEALGEICCLKGKMFWHETNTLAAATVSKQTPGPRTQLLQQEFKQIHRAHVSVRAGPSSGCRAERAGLQMKLEGDNARSGRERGSESGAVLLQPQISLMRGCRDQRKLSHAAHR